MTLSFRKLVKTVLLLLFARNSSAFTLKPPAAFSGLSPIAQSRSFSDKHRSSKCLKQPCMGTNSKPLRANTQLSMYNLPPGKNDNEIGDILKGAASLALVVAFFASPLGGFVLGVFNSFFLLALLLPILGTVGFNVWNYFNTITGDCPNCGAPARVLKTNSQGEASPSICISCGSILQANYDNTRIDNITGKNTVDGLTGGASIFDLFGGVPPSASTTSTTTTSIFEETTRESREKTSKRESTIIDVEIEDDKPWQWASIEQLKITSFCYNIIRPRPIQFNVAITRISSDYTAKLFSPS